MISGARQGVVGEFFEQVGHRILGGDLSRDETGDICLWKVRTAVEVKSSCYKSSYGFRLSTEQIEHYERIACFPFDRSWYLFFSYRNDQVLAEGKRKVTELSLQRSALETNHFLAEATLWGLLVDVSIVSRWKEVMEHSTKSILGWPGKETVDLKCQQLYPMTNGGLAKELGELGFSAGDFSALNGTIQAEVKPDLFRTFDMRFPLRAVLPKRDAKSLQRILKNRGFNFSLSSTEAQQLEF